MFSYHDANDCSFDLWSPTRYNAIDNRAFSAVAKHITERDEVVNAILNGQTSFTLDDDFCQADLDYINKKLAEHGIYADLSLE